MEVLTILREDYEAQRYPMPLPDPIEAIIYHMESRGMTPYDLEPYIGNASDVADILHRRRALSLEMIRGLYAGPGISLDILMPPYPLFKTAA